MYSLFCDVTQLWLVISNWHYPSFLQGSSSFVWTASPSKDTASPWKLGQILCPETSVNNYQLTPRRGAKTALYGGERTQPIPEQTTSKARQCDGKQGKALCGIDSECRLLSVYCRSKFQSTLLWKVNFRTCPNVGRLVSCLWEGVTNRHRTN